MEPLYHRVPELLGEGTVLHPLNQLRHINPQAYTHHMKKYVGREWLHKRRIPSLGLMWGDALQLSKVHPLKIKKALLNVGAHFSGQFYVITDPELVNPEHTTVFKYSQPVYTDIPFEPTEFEDFNPDRISEYTMLTEATKEHYHEFMDKGRTPYPWHRTAHILYAGELDVSQCEIIKV